MTNRAKFSTAVLSCTLAMVAVTAFSQGPPELGGMDGPFPGPPGMRGGGPMGGPERKLVDEFDANDDGWLDAEERASARASIPARGEGRGEGRGGRNSRRGPGGPFGRTNREPPKPGESVAPQDVVNYPDAPLYDPKVLRTIFLDFENPDWEAELEAFHNSDVEVPATLTVDGKQYHDVGVHFRGMSSYGMVPTGFKRSLNVSLDCFHGKQRIYGYKTLNLLNCSGDSSMMSTILYSQIARDFIPAPQANLVKVVINGENWGIYTNVEQFNKVFLEENFKPSSGTRWKVSGSPRGDGGLRYMGEDIEEYERRYEMKSNDGILAWKALMELCWMLNETPLEELETTLDPILDIDGVLKFLALDVALVNSDGYWTRASDYSLFLDKDGKFHVIPHDMNEAFHGGGGPRGFRPPGADREDGPPRDRVRRERRPEFEGSARDDAPADGRPQRGDRPGPPRLMDRLPDGSDRPDANARRRDRPGGRGPGGPGHGGVDLDPLVGIDNPRMPLRSRLLAVPALRVKYLEYVRSIADTSLDWKNLGPIVAQYRELIASEVEADTRKLDSYEAFMKATDPAASEGTSDQAMSLRSFADQRRAYLLKFLESNQ